MKQHICLLFVLTSISLNAQIEFGLKAGAHSYDYDKITNIELNGGDTSFTLDPQAASYGYHFGLYSRVNVLGFYIEPAFILNSTSVDYRLSSEDLIDDIRSESFLNLDIPVLIGIPILPFLSAKVGPVGHITLDSSSELFDINGYAHKTNDLKYGFQLGLGLDFWKLRLDALFEGNFNRFGDHIEINGEPFAFDEKPSRLVFNLGYKF